MKKKGYKLLYKKLFAPIHFLYLSSTLFLSITARKLLNRSIPFVFFPSSTFYKHMIIGFTNINIPIQYSKVEIYYFSQVLVSKRSFILLSVINALIRLMHVTPNPANNIILTISSITPSNCGKKNTAISIIEL